LFICIEASAPPRIVVMRLIMAGPTIVGVIGVVMRSMGPVIATGGVTIAPMPDFLDCSSTKLDYAQRHAAWLAIGWGGCGEHHTHRARSSKEVQI
jgi:hypothetical protein